MNWAPGKIGTPRSPGSPFSFSAAFEGAGELVGADGGGCAGGFKGAWPGRGNGAGVCAAALKGNAIRLTPSTYRPNISAVIALLSHRILSLVPYPLSAF